jgi:hypothetical protein
VAGKRSTQAKQALETLEEARRKLDRVYALVEQYAAARDHQDTMAPPISRAASDVARVLLADGYGVLGDTANQISMLAKRGGATMSKFRGLREMTASIRAGIESEQKIILSEIARAGQAAADESAAPKDPGSQAPPSGPRTTQSRKLES